MRTQTQVSFGVALVGILVAGGAAIAQSPCGPQGLSLAFNGGRLGDVSSLELTGSPMAPGLLGLDVSGGPVLTPAGGICLGFTPAMQLLPFALDAQGKWQVADLIPANPFLDGFGVFAQAAAFDTTQPNNVALSNGLHPVLRSPRLWIFTKPPTAPAFCIYDVVTTTATSSIPLPLNVIGAAPAPALGWMVVTLQGSPTVNSRIMAFDSTGATTLDIPLPLGTTVNSKPYIDGTTIVVHTYTGSGGPGSWFIQTFAMPSGAQLLNFPLTIPAGIMVIAKPGLALAKNGFDVVPIDLVTGTLLPPVSLNVPPGTSNGIFFGRLHGGVLWIFLHGTGPIGIFSPAGVTAFDVASLTTLLPAPLLMPIVGNIGGPYFATDATGPAAFMINGTYLIRIDATNFTMSSPLSGVTTGSVDVSAGGGEILTYTGYGLSRIDLATYSFSNLGGVFGGLSPPAYLATLPSATFRKAFLITTAYVWQGFPPANYLVEVATDPTVLPPIIWPLPLSSFDVTVVVD